MFVYSRNHRREFPGLRLIFPLISILLTAASCASWLDLGYNTGLADLPQNAINTSWRHLHTLALR